MSSVTVEENILEIQEEGEELSPCCKAGIHEVLIPARARQCVRCGQYIFPEDSP